MKKEILEWIVSIAVALIIVGIVVKFIGVTYSVSGDSMYPTFKDREKVVVSKISKTLDHIDNGDIVVFKEDKDRDFIKRLIGKPGDKVEYKGDQLYVNNKKIDEPYLKYNKEHKNGKYLTGSFKSSDLQNANGETKIPKDKYLVLGDNRQNSLDSRFPQVGLIHKEQIVGKVVSRFWPFGEWTTKFNPGTFDK